MGVHHVNASQLREDRRQHAEEAFDHYQILLAFALFNRAMDVRRRIDVLFPLLLRGVFVVLVDADDPKCSSLFYVHDESLIE